MCVCARARVCVCVQSEMSEEDLAVLADEALSSPDFIAELRSDFIEHLNAMKALSAHGPVYVLTSYMIVHVYTSSTVIRVHVYSLYMYMYVVYLTILMTHCACLASTCTCISSK